MPNESWLPKNILNIILGHSALDPYQWGGITVRGIVEAIRELQRQYPREGIQLPGCREPWSEEDGEILTKYNQGKFWEHGNFREVEAQDARKLAESQRQASNSEGISYSARTYQEGVYNTGTQQQGTYESGAYNAGIQHPGAYAQGAYNTGIQQPGTYESGVYNTGVQPGTYESCPYSAGVQHPQTYNTGTQQQGTYNTENQQSGTYGGGAYNAGAQHPGTYNTGDRYWGT
ncbi:predicted protein [Sclerotinia sclerotiorum 1980 UF-70]|nr:predicted protein [Sclerotinia sclerotiorum 1980 UF-70]EDO04552.1 predicted protein [Sclerotinia sclerotiorum 1980 UF-70]